MPNKHQWVPINLQWSSEDIPSLNRQRTRNLIREAVQYGLKKTKKFKKTKQNNSSPISTTKKLFGYR